MRKEVPPKAHILLHLPSKPSLPCFALCHRGRHLWEHFLNFFTSQLPFGFDQWETLTGDWKAGGRNKPMCFSPSHSTSVASLWGTKSLL